MAEHTTAESIPAHRRRARHFKVAAIVTLALGIVGVGIVCVMAMNSESMADDSPSVGYYKRTAQEAERLYGKPAVLMDDIQAALGRPGTQVIIITAVAALVAGGCWLAARKLESRD
jgi:hypothetical protein